jgi:hypothetical protein
MGILDRAVRTIKLLMKKRIAESDDPRWPAHLGEIIQLYNDTPHSSLENRPPSEAYKDLAFLMAMQSRDRKHNSDLHKLVNAGFQEGDRVRIAMPKGTFSKEQAHYSRELYTIQEPKGHGFMLVDEKGIDVGQTYLARDLQKVDEVVDRLQSSTADRSRKVNGAARALSHCEGLHRTYAAAAKAVKQANKRGNKKETIASRVLKAAAIDKHIVQKVKQPWYKVAPSSLASKASETRIMRDRSCIRAPMRWPQEKQPHKKIDNIK